MADLGGGSRGPVLHFHAIFGENWPIIGWRFPHPLAQVPLILKSLDPPLPTTNPSGSHDLTVCFPIISLRLGDAGYQGSTYYLAGELARRYNAR